MDADMVGQVLVKCVVMALLTLGAVKVCDIVDWWFTRKTRRVMVQRLVLPEEVERATVDDELYRSTVQEEVWEDCPAIDRFTLPAVSQRFPGAHYRTVRLGEDD